MHHLFIFIHSFHCTDATPLRCRLLTVSTVLFIRVVTAIIVAITHVPSWNTKSTRWTLELTGTATCHTHTHTHTFDFSVMLASVLKCGLCDGTHTSFMCESDERHIGGWVGTGSARLAYCDWLL